jgi:hypothetical protein
MPFGEGLSPKEALATRRQEAAQHSPGKGPAFQRRAASGGLSIHTSGGSGTAPTWVKLQRAGPSITACVSSDGVSWSTVGIDTIELGDTMYVGLALTSHRDGALASASFDNVSVGGLR